MTTTVEAGALRRSNTRGAPAVSDELRADPAGAVHAFVPGATWSRCRHHTRSLTTAYPQPRGPRCAACGLDEEKPMPIHPIRTTRRWLARRVLRLVGRMPQLHAWLARLAWRIAPPETPERTLSTRALVATVSAWRVVDKRADDASAIAATENLPRVLRLTAGMIESERREREQRS